MPKTDYSDYLATQMNNLLNDEENMKLFSSAEKIEKLAFKKISEENQTTEVEAEMEKSLEKKASEEIPVKTEKPSFTVSAAVSTLMQISADLDDNGFEVLAEESLILADKLICQAAGTTGSSSSKSDEKKSKSKSKKMDMKERMKKMREMKGKGKGKKSAPKSKSKSVSKTAQTVSNPLLDNLIKHLPAELAHGLHWKHFAVSQDNDGLIVSGEFEAVGSEPEMLAVVKASGKSNLPTYLSDMLKTLDPRVKKADLVKSFKA